MFNFDDESWPIILVPKTCNQYEREDEDCRYILLNETKICETATLLKAKIM